MKKLQDINNLDDMIGNVINADCLEVMKMMPDKSVDLILTDPPYGMSFVSNHRKQKYQEISGDNDLIWLDDFVLQAYRISKDNSAHYVFCSFHNIDIFKSTFQRLFNIKNILVWEKNNTSMGDLKGDFAPKAEFILFMQKGRKTINGKRDPNILRFDRTGNDFHPTQKPVPLFQYLLSKFSNETDLVFDPFIGSGTTALACEQLNRRWIGCEIAEKYCKVADDRVRAYRNQTKLFS